MKKSAGQPEKQDVVVQISDDQTPLKIEISSPVKDLFGKAILQTVEEELISLDVIKGTIIIQDYQALDFVLRARVKAAVYNLRNSGGKI
jgi:citrate lyase subunit gamma (acyl carrier protein)